MIGVGAGGMRPMVVVSALGLVQIFGYGSTYYLLAVLAGPIAQDTGWPVGGIMGSLSIAFLVGAMVSPAVGAAVARAGGRRVLAAGCALIAAGLLILALAPSIWVFTFGWIVIGAGMAGALYDPAFATLGRLYGRKSRNAISVLTLWGGFASTVCWPLSAWFLAEFGWRGTAAIYALIHLCLSLPLVLIFIPHEAPVAAPPPARGTPALQMVPGERLAFWLIAASLVTVGLVSTIISVHLLGFLTAQGQAMAGAVALGALIGPAQVGGRLLDLVFAARHHPIWTMGAGVLAIAMGLILLALGLPWAGVALVLYGAGNGIFSVARGALPMALFGPERYAQIMGRLALPAMAAQAVAPLLASALIGWTGPSGTVQVLVALGLLNLLWIGALVLLMPRLPPPD